MTEKEIFDKIASIAATYSGLKVQDLNLNTSINHDLQIDGDDIEDMIFDINKAVELNFEGFDYSNYFNSESEIGLISSMFKMLFRKNKPNYNDYDFKLGDFVRWKIEGFWKEAN